MAVYKRSYKSYDGPVTLVRDRWLAVTRYSLSMAFSSRISIVLFVLCLVPPVIGTLVIYLMNNELVLATMQLGKAPFGIDNKFFVFFLEIQSWLALFLTAWIGPATIAPDLSNQALPLFLSRPLSRTKYVLGKVLVLAGVLSIVTWLPLLLMFTVQSQLSKTAWFTSNWYMLPGIFLGCWLWIAVLSLVSLAVSSWVRWRIVATGATIAILLVPAGFGQVVNVVMRTRWGTLVNVPYLMTLIWTHLLRVPLPFPERELPLSMAWVAMLGAAAISLLVLHRRIVARQVVSG
jgi:ABC-type transport system involved in multi-copper enzyme maturation permease subunit